MHNCRDSSERQVKAIRLVAVNFPAKTTQLRLTEYFDIAIVSSGLAFGIRRALHCKSATSFFLLLVPQQQASLAAAAVQYTHDPDCLNFSKSAVLAYAGAIVIDEISGCLQLKMLMGLLRMAGIEEPAGATFAWQYGVGDDMKLLCIELAAMHMTSMLL